TASWLILWFLVTRLYAKVVCTAPTARQLDDVLWSELSKWIRKSIVADEFVIQKNKIFHKHSPKEWWCRAVSVSARASKEEQAETLAGFHGDHLLIVVDEASGVNDPVFIPLEGAMTQEDNRCLLIGNMTKNAGYFYDSHYHVDIRKKWDKLHWDSRESTNVSPEMVQYFIDKYGKDSSIFAVRVAGDPPHADDQCLIPLAWSMQCVDNDIGIPEDEPLYLGVDVARYGNDDSIILPRRGNWIHEWKTYHNMNTISLGGEIVLTGVDLEAQGVAIDEIGVGAGVTDWLTKHGAIPTFGVNVACASSDIKKYHKLRDELWVRVKEKCMQGQYRFPGGKLGDELCNELASVGYDFNTYGGIVVDSKKLLKSKGKESPNVADALGLSEYFQNAATQVFKDKRKRRKRSPSYNNRHSWMVV
ncbi:MAG: hypothetical protein U9N61_12710, partial [Euryarchaeota archaeon]|nr:hypothetical protein [Euryarchaeota archaeon]